MPYQIKQAVVVVFACWLTGCTSTVALKDPLDSYTGQNITLITTDEKRIDGTLISVDSTQIVTMRLAQSLDNASVPVVVRIHTDSIMYSQRTRVRTVATLFLVLGIAALVSLVFVQPDYDFDDWK